MYYARDIPEDRQENINPELRTNPYLQKHAQRWEKDRDYDAPEIHGETLSLEYALTS